MVRSGHHHAVLPDGGTLGCPAPTGKSAGATGRNSARRVLDFAAKAFVKAFTSAPTDREDGCVIEPVRTPRRRPEEADADVIVVGAGPAGSTTAYHLAQSGLDVLLMEKTAFPREKVCGDGLTPRAVKQLLAMGIDTRPEDGWIRNHGLRIIGGGMRLELPWPDLATFPNYGLVRTREDFDEILAHQAQKAGARLMERTNVSGPVLDAAGRITGVSARTRRGRTQGRATYRAPIVVASDGNSTRLSLAMGLRKRDDRPLGVAVRTYYTSPRTTTTGWSPGWNCGTAIAYSLVTAGSSGWATARSTLASAFSTRREPFRTSTTETCCGVGSTPHRSSGAFARRTAPRRFAAPPYLWASTARLTTRGGCFWSGMPAEWSTRSTARASPTPWSPGRMAAETIVQALGRPTAAGRERALEAYPLALKEAYGGYYTLGRLFVKLIGNPNVMKLATRHGLPHPTLMRFTLKLLANLTDPAMATPWTA